MIYEISVGYDLQEMSDPENFFYRLARQNCLENCLNQKIERAVSSRAEADLEMGDFLRNMSLGFTYLVCSHRLGY